MRVLGDPTTCPHGNPIPGLRLPRARRRRARRPRRRQRLHREPHPRGAGVHARPARVPRGLRLLPGRSGTVTAASPDGTTTVEIDGHHVGIGAFAAARILVTSGSRPARYSTVSSPIMPLEAWVSPSAASTMQNSVYVPGLELVGGVARLPGGEALELEGAAARRGRPRRARHRR